MTYSRFLNVACKMTLITWLSILLFQLPLLYLLFLHLRYWPHWTNYLPHILLHTSLSLNMWSLCLEYSHRYSVKLFLMPEAESITLLPLLTEPRTPQYYSMYHPKLQLILYMLSHPHPHPNCTGNPLKARAMSVFAHYLFLCTWYRPSTQ